MATGYFVSYDNLIFCDYIIQETKEEGGSGRITEDEFNDVEYLEQLPPQASVPTPSALPTSIQCKCTPDQKHGETSIMCCNDCGLPCEPFWDVVAPTSQQGEDKTETS